MPSKLSKLLNQEHQIILDALDLIPKLSNFIVGDPQKYKVDVSSLLDFFKEYADQFHHHKEEVILFPEIAKRFQGTGNDFVVELLDQHDEFRGMLSDVRRNLASDKLDQVQLLLEQYSELLRDHISAEDNEFFPMADTLLSEDELELFYHQSIDKDTEMSMDVKNKYEAMIGKQKEAFA